MITSAGNSDNFPFMKQTSKQIRWMLWPLMMMIVGVSTIMAQADQLVIEGTVLSAKRNFVSGMIFTARVVEINRIFAGTTDQTVIEVLTPGGSVAGRSVSISHGQMGLPGEGATAIFVLEAVASSREKSFLANWTPYPLYWLREHPKLLFPVPSHLQHRATDSIYVRLEAKYQRPAQLVRLPATTNELAIRHAMDHQLPIPNRQIGLIYQLVPPTEPSDTNTVRLRILLNGTNAILSLDSASVDLRYNPRTFGAYLARRGKVRYHVRRHPHLSVPTHYQISVIDVDSNQIRIQWHNPTPAVRSMQIQPRPRGRLMLELSFPVANPAIPMGLQLVAGETERNRYYDRFQPTHQPIDYLVADSWVHPGLRALDLIPPSIEALLPTGPLAILDTLLIKGQGFRTHTKVQLYGKAASGHYRHREVPPPYILSRTDTMITLIIPPYLLPKRGTDLSRQWQVAQGTVRLLHQVGRFFLDTFSDHKLSAGAALPSFPQD